MLIVYILISCKPNAIPNAVLSASDATKLAATYYEIYDRSTPEICDRLIIVQPFRWFIWAKNGLVYLLNATNQTCPITYTPSTIVPGSVNLEDTFYSFKSVCLYIVFNDIVESYKSNSIKVKLNFDIEEIQDDPKKFTILDALNDLFKNYITMDSVNIQKVEAHATISLKELLKNYTSKLNLDDKIVAVRNNLKRLKKKAVL